MFDKRDLSSRRAVLSDGIRCAEAAPENAFEELKLPRIPVNRETANPAPACAEPSRSPTFRWLTFGLIAGATATLASSASALAIGATALLYSGSHWCLGAAIFAAASSIVLPAIRVAFHSNKPEPDLWRRPYGEEGRIRGAVRSLSAERGIPSPQVRESEKLRTLGLLDLPGSKNILIFNPEASGRLNDTELRGVLAHELEHGDRWYSGYNFLASSLRSAATVTMTWAAGHGIFTLLSSPGFMGKLLPIGAAIAGMAATSIAMKAAQTLIANIACRANELRTDIRAVESTKNLPAYLEGMRKLYEYLHEDSSEIIVKLQPIAGHPPLEKRLRWIRKACGEQV